MNVMKALLHGVFVGVTGDTTRLRAMREQLTPEQAVQRYFDVVRASNPSDRLREALDRAQAEYEAARHERHGDRA